MERRQRAPLEAGNPRGISRRERDSFGSAGETFLARSFAGRPSGWARTLAEKFRSWDLVPLLAILFVAGFLRFYRVGLDEFKGDEAWWCIEAETILYTGRVRAHPGLEVAWKAGLSGNEDQVGFGFSLMVWLDLLLKWVDVKT